MRIAIPLLGEDIAPRFCSADRFLVADVAEGQVLGERILTLAPADLGEQVSVLARLGADHLLCGGFNRRYRAMAAGLGLEVHWGLWGDARTVLADFAAGRPLASLGPRGCGRGRRHRGG